MTTRTQQDNDNYDAQLAELRKATRESIDAYETAYRAKVARARAIYLANKS